VCVDAEGGVGFAVSESALDVDEVVVECDQHAGVAVAEIVQGRSWCWEATEEVAAVHAQRQRRRRNRCRSSGGTSPRARWGRCSL
jgi:hypothetical protein